ncbi:MAG: pilus assembly protein TadG-related protein [Acidimicrobiales bacterium]
MRRDQRGATAVVVALLIVPLFGFGALVLDVGALYQEKRELQNGADAAAMAVARDCAAGACGSASVTADTYADANANDGQSNIDQICGVGPGLTACAAPAPTVPAGVNGYVRVTTATRETSSGTNQITYGLARVLTSQTGQTVKASTVVAWGAPGGKITTQLTISKCEFDSFTDPLGLGIRVFAISPFTGLPKTIFFHNTSSAGTCPAGPSGADLPGGFGWLDSVNCGALINAGNWVNDKTGNSVPSDCHPSQWQNQTILLPIYDATNGLNGSNGSYHIAGFAAFYVVGYRFPSEKFPSNVKCTLLDNSSSVCLKGYFTKYLTSADTFGGAGSDFGVTTVKITG